MEVSTGNIDGENQNSCSWTEKERCHSYSYSRRSRKIRLEGESFRNQSKRVDRAHGTQPCFTNSRTATTGGILLQLIEEAQNQIAVRESEVLQLHIHVQKLRTLLDQLEQSE